MDILMIALILVAIAHLIYEEAIGPFLRTRQKFLLLEQRDRLRRLYIEKGDAIGEEAFSNLESRVNATIRQAPQILVTVLYDAVREYKDNDILRAEVHTHAAIVDSCADLEFQEIYRQSLLRFRNLLGINTLPLALSLAAPLLLFWAIGVYQQRVNVYQQRIKQWLRDSFSAYSRSATV
ncbi:MAG: hypothetical protein GKR94_05320 [Gammaproteobacteria bacterium]|nr:hypothetical protein [Gammaproteobacteria bacterium]